MKYKNIGVLCFLMSCTFANAQTSQSIQIKNNIQQNESQIMESFKELLAIPNIAANPVGIEHNANWIANYMQSKGIQKVQLLKDDNAQTPPVVYGEVMTPGVKETVIFYAHYDGQPVDSTKWAKGLHPFKPSLYSDLISNGGLPISWPNKETAFDLQSRIYGRGASDDKAGVMAIINAYATLAQLHIKPTINIKFFFEGEEEAGSPHLSALLKKHKSLLESDIWVICDGPVHQSGRKQIVYGVRGDTHIELTVFGPKRPLHSGHYGNWVLNPAMELARLLASMKNDKGEVTIAGFYDDVTPLTVSEKEALASIPSVDAQLKNELGILATERNMPINDALQFPSLNVNGIQSAGVGKLSANVIPTKAIASIDLRLVKGNDWKRQQEKVINHIKAQGFFVTYNEPTDEQRKQHNKICMVALDENSYNAQKTSMDNPFAKRIAKAMQLGLGSNPVLVPTVGGSLPLFVFEQELNTAPITVPIANHDNNQHAENENIKLKNFFEGIQIFSAIMTLAK
jgi:acetylornithine deacetylase/succinyl-diaminopimelate desuccinylase-like protein